MINISIVGTNGLPANYSGWETLVSNLVSEKSKDLKYYIQTPYKRKNEVDTYNNKFQPIFSKFNANGLQSIFYDLDGLIKSRNKDIILVLGYSGAIFFPLIKPFLKGKLICNPDGLEHRRSKFNFLTRLFLKLSEYLSCKFSDGIISDNKGITDYLLGRYKKINVIGTIGYGGRYYLNLEKLNKTKDLLSKFNLTNKEFDLAVARIEPENNVNIILNSYIGKSKKLLFFGNWNKTSLGLEIKKNFSSSNIILADPNYDYEVLDILRSLCRYYIHGHSVGGTNPSLVEAITQGCTIFSYDCEFNRASNFNDGNIFFWKSSDQLSFLIDTNKNAFQNPSNNYTNLNWSTIVKEYEKTLLSLN